MRDRLLMLMLTALKLMALRLTALTLTLMAIAFSPAGAQAQTDAEQEANRALDAKCEAARAAMLAPIRRELAQQCEQEPRRGANKEEECRLETSTYGDTFSGPRGAAIQGMYYDLPECMTARAAWQKWEKDRPWKR